MKRLGLVIVLTVLATTAGEAGSYNFSIGGRHIRIQAPQSCRSTACLSVTTMAREDRGPRGDAPVAPAAMPASPPPAPATMSPAPAPQPVQGCAPAAAPSALPPPAPPLAAATVLAAVTTQPVALPPLPAAVPVIAASVPSLEPPRLSRAEIAPVLQDSRDDSADDLPIGLWESEGSKGLVRIERCGPALCGYAVNDGQSGRGESVLVNMKTTTSEVWSGRVYSRDTGNTYHATMSPRGRSRLHVEACALGRFFCSGHDWRRVEPQDEHLLTTSRQGVGSRS